MTDNRRMVSETKLAIRLPKPLKRRISAEAKSRMVSEADITREALLNYFSRRNPQADEEKAVAA